MAIACLRLVTTPPLPFFPERSLPRFSLCIAFLTLSLAALLYFAISPPSSALFELTANRIWERDLLHLELRRRVFADWTDAAGKVSAVARLRR